MEANEVVNVLVVDDCAAIAQMSENILKESGKEKGLKVRVFKYLEILGAGDYVSQLNEKIHVVVTDYNRNTKFNHKTAEDERGAPFLQAIQTKYGNIPIIVLTGFDEYKEEIIKFGAFFVEKDLHGEWTASLELKFRELFDLSDKSALVKTN